MPRFAALVLSLFALGGAATMAQAQHAAPTTRPAPPRPAAARTLTVKDDLGRAVTLKLPIRRTVSINGANTELVRSIAGMGVVVGVDSGSVKERAYWPGVTDSMLVGEGQLTPNYEAIIALKPDLVLIPKNGDWERAVKVLAPFNIPVVVMTGWDLARHDFNVDLVGRIYEKPAEAQRLKAFCARYETLLHARLPPPGQRRKVYLEQGPDYTTVLQGSGWHDMIERGGGVNIFREVEIGKQAKSRGTNQVFAVDPEEILARNPDIIVKLEPFTYKPLPREVSATTLNAIAARPGFGQLTAVKTGQVYHLGRLLGDGCGKGIGSVQIAKWLYPERFKDIDPSAELAKWFTTFQGVPFPGGYWISLAQLRDGRKG